MERKYTTLWHDTLDSTNSEAARRLPELDNLSVIAARCQTAGRGQRGNTWSAAPGENLTFSIVLKFGDDSTDSLPSLWGVSKWGKTALSRKADFQTEIPVLLTQQRLLHIVTSTAVTNYLTSKCGLNVKIKWPNDIYVENKKICGILIENAVREDRLLSSVIGVGLNVNQTEFPPNLPNPTSIAVETGRGFDITMELEKLLRCFDRNLTAVLDDGAASLENVYMTHLYGINERREFVRADTGERFSGRILGVTKEFKIVIADENTGDEETFAFKEIKYVISGREQV